MCATGTRIADIAWISRVNRGTPRSIRSAIGGERFASRDSALLTVVTGHSPTSAVQNALVSPGLDSVVAAVADLEDHELGALIAMVDDGPQIAPGLFAWIEHVCDWELNRRQGLDFPLQPPEAAIEPEEIPTSIVALSVLRATFGRDPDSASQAVSVLLDAVSRLLIGDGRRQ